MSVADFLNSSGMIKIGWEYINLDDCWAGYVDIVLHSFDACLDREMRKEILQLIQLASLTVLLCVIHRK